MATNKEEIIIDVQINIGDVEKQLGVVTKKIDLLKESNKGLRSEMSELKKAKDFDEKSWASLNAQLVSNEQEIKSLKNAEKELAGQISIADQQRRSYSDSFKGQAAQLADLKNQYASLTKAERESAGGKEMLAHITELDKAVKSNDASLGQFQRNVGNYPSQNTAFASTFDLIKNKVTGTTEKIGGFFETLKSAKSPMDLVKAGVGGLGTSLSALAANPIIAVITVMVVIFNSVKDAISSSSKASNTLKEAMAPLGAVMTVVKNVAVALVQVFLDGFLMVSKFATAIYNLVAGNDKYSQSIAKAMEVERESQKIKGDTRKLQESEAKNQLEIAKLRDKVTEKDKYSRDERRAFLLQAIELEKNGMEEKKKLAQRELNNLIEQQKRKAELNGEDKQALTDAKVKLLNIEKDYYTGIRRMKTQAATFNKQEDEEIAKKAEETEKRRLQALKDAEERRKQLAKNALDASRALEDAQNEAIKDAVDKAVEIEKDSNRRKIEDLKAKLSEDKNLTKQARSDINATIEQLEANSEEKIRKIKEDAIRDKLQKDLTAEQNRIQILLDTAQKGSQNELDLRYKAIENLRQQELAGAELTEKDKQLINAKYDKQKEEAEKQAIKRSADLKKQALDNEFAEMKLKLDEQNASELERSQLELEQAQAQSDALISIDAKQKEALYETEEAYNSAVIASKQKVVDASQAVMQSEQKLLELQVATFQGFGSAISDVLSEVASNSKEALVFQKFIALANSALNLATAISAATASSVAGDPYTMALRIASNVASVIISFSQVTKAINSANVPTPPKFATGGIVSGTSFTGDKVPALVNSGEMILNQEQQAKLFAMVAGGGMVGGGGIDYQALANAMSKQPAPVLNYAEFTQFQQKIVTFEEITKI